MKIFPAFKWVCICTFLFFIILSTVEAQTQAVPFAVSFWYPTNSQSFLAPAMIGVHARVTDSNVVRTVQYFSGATSIGIVGNTSNILLTNSSQSNPFFLSWSNVAAGSYSLTAVAVDSAGGSATSAPVNINVTNPIIRPLVYIYSPTNGSTLIGPTNLTLYARAVESGGAIATIQFIANNVSLGIASNSNQMVFTNVSSEPLFSLMWTNVQLGSYTLKAIATDTNGNTATSSVVNISIVTNIPLHTSRPSVAIYSPANGMTYITPTNLTIYARAVETSGMVASVQFFANDTNLGICTYSNQAFYSNISSVPLFAVTWSNVPAGSYALKAIAMDTNNNTSTSSIVSISVKTNYPPPNVPFFVSFWYPTNSQGFVAPANIGIHALVTDSNVVQTVQYFANSLSIGTVTNYNNILLTSSTQSNPFFLLWSNVPAGNYNLTALATDNSGNTATSAPISIIVTNNPPPIIPFAVSFWYPTNGQTFLAPANIGLHARVTDSNLIESVQYFSGSTLIGTVQNTNNVLLTSPTQSNPFFFLWTNVLAGNYLLTAVALDSQGNSATSAPVNIFVVTNLPPTVRIYAPDPVAVEGTNYNPSFPIPAGLTNYINGTNTATFLVQRDNSTNVDLTINYSISGTAINGVDYETLPGSITIPAGKTYALITIVPLEDDTDYRYYDTVILSILPADTNAPTSYWVGSPQQAGAIVLEENYLPMSQPVIRSLEDNSLHVSLPATNGLNFCLEVSTDMVNWIPVCTNTVIKGSAQYVDPSGSGNSSLYYRIIPVATPANY